MDRRGRVFVTLCCGALCIASETAVAGLQFTAETIFPDASGATSLASDNQGAAMMAWCAVGALGGTLGTDCDVLVSRYPDEDGLWSDPAPLNSNAALDKGEDARVAVATGGGGTWIAAWESTDELGRRLGTDYDVVFSRSTDNGRTWSNPLPLNNNAAKDQSKAQDTRVRLATNGAGVWAAAWSLTGVGTGLGTRLSRSYDDGLSWNDITSFPPGNLDEARITCSIDNNSGQERWIVAAKGFDALQGVCLFESASDDGGLSWSPWYVAMTGDRSYTHPALSANNAGSVVLLYSASTTKVSYSEDLGQSWSSSAAINPVPALDPTRYDQEAALATSEQGVWIAAWATLGGLGGTLGEDFDLLYGESTDDGATWSVPEPVNANAYTDTVDDTAPQVACVADNEWLVSWSGYDPETGLPALHVAQALWTPSVSEKGINVTPTFDYLYTTENGGTASFSVNLKSAPESLVHVTLSSNDVSEGIVSPDTLIFDATNSRAFQEVTITGQSDDDVGDQNYHIELTSQSEDSHYDGITVSIPVVNLEPLVGVDSVTFWVVKRVLKIGGNVFDRLGEPVSNAVVDIELYCNGISKGVYSDVSATTGYVLFNYENPAYGEYTLEVRSVTAEGLVWDGIQPTKTFIYKK